MTGNLLAPERASPQCPTSRVYVCCLKSPVSHAPPICRKLPDRKSCTRAAKASKHALCERARVHASGCPPSYPTQRPASYNQQIAVPPSASAELTEKLQGASLRYSPLPVARAPRPFGLILLTWVGSNRPCRPGALDRGKTGPRI